MMKGEPKPEIKNPEQEEQDGLDRYYSEVVPDSLCEANFEVWRGHLLKELSIKYPAEQERDQAIKRAEEFIKTLPLFHGTDLENLVSLTKTGKLRSNFISRETDLMHKNSGNTASFDRENELDHFVYFFVGYPKNTGRQVQMFLRQTVLDNSKTRVSLEDHGWGTIHRLLEARNDGVWPKARGSKEVSSGPEDAFEIQKSQIWKGPDFQKLFPLMLALAYDNPDEFIKETPVPKNLIPEGHLPAIEKYDFESQSYKSTFFPKFEVRVPASVDTSDVVLVVYDRDFEYLSANEKIKKVEEDMNHVTFDTLRIPPGVTPEKRAEIIRGAVAKRMSGTK